MTTTHLDIVSHDLELMMPGSQLMITGSSGGFGSVGGMTPPGMIPPGMVPPGMVPPTMGGFPQPGGFPTTGGMMGGFGQQPSPYGSRGPY